MTSSPLKRLFVHTSHYSLASLLTTLAGLVSFPLLTRIFSVADYGVIGFISVTMTIAVAIGKLGVQHAVLRDHSEIAVGKRPFTLQQLSSTTVFGMASTGLAVALLLVVGSQLAPASLVGEPRVRGLLAIAFVCIAIRIIESPLVNFIRAEQRTKLFVVYQVAKKYLWLGLMLLALLAFARSLTAFYSAMVVAETMGVIGLAVALFAGRGRPRPSPRQFSVPLFKQMLQFGIPMMFGIELSGIVLAVGDRYAIQWLIGAAPVGLYSAAYNLCEYIQTTFITSIGQAITPMYMQMWDRRGPEETAAFIASSLRTYVLFSAPVIAGVAAVGPELLPALASEKYAVATGVLPWVMAGMVVDGASSMAGAGLFIHRRTPRIMAIVMSCAALNIGLNIVLVPRVGIIGAAIATLVSYAASALLFAASGRNLLPIALPWPTLVRAGAASALMYLAVAYVLPGQRFVTVGVRAVMGAGVYAVLLLLIDADARTITRRVLGRFGWSMNSPGGV